MNKDKEPLLSWKEWLTINPNADMQGSWIKAYAKYHTEWHLKQCSEVVCENVETVTQTYGSPYQSEWTKTVNKQSITNAIENYINLNIK